MSILVQLFDVAKSYGSRNLFSKGNATVHEGDRIGLIGANGAGKSTLFKIIAKKLDLDSGQVILSRQLSLGYLEQDLSFQVGMPLSEHIELKSGRPLWEIESLAPSLGLTPEVLATPIDSLSGGYRMRGELLALLCARPNLLLLDEPTNYLDLESLLAFEAFLRTFKGAFVLISHDREFLRRMTDSILEIENGDFTRYDGSIDQYFEYKAEVQLRNLKMAQSQEAKRTELLKFAARFGAKATKAKQVKSRLKQIRRMDSISTKPLAAVAKIAIPAPIHTGKQILFAEQVRLGYGATTVLDKIDLVVRQGEHIGVVGVNGAGKSTFLKALAGELKPQKGELRWGHNVEMAYYAQHVSEGLRSDDTVIESMARGAHPTVIPQDVQDMAGHLLFSNEDVNKKIAILSGGERARVALGQVLLKKAPCILMDEPTNHLDFHTVEALTQALESFTGSLFIVSHDRSFVGRVAKQIIEISNGRVDYYSGTYDSYLWRQEQLFGSGVEATKDNKKASNKGPTKSESQKPRVLMEDSGAKKHLRRKIKNLEIEIRKMVLKINALETEMAELNVDFPSATGGDRELVLKRMEEVHTAQQKTEAKWLHSEAALEKLKAE